LLTLKVRGCGWFGRGARIKEGDQMMEMVLEKREREEGSLGRQMLVGELAFKLYMYSVLISSNLRFLSFRPFLSKTASHRPTKTQN
jgi:hypothetical protein